MSGIVFFDGECNLCQWSVQFIIERDQRGYFKFASLQSNAAKRLLAHAPEVHNEQSVVLLENGKLYTQSTAALNIVRQLDGNWKLLYGFIIVPAVIRNLIYRVIARYRLDWFGKANQCMLPNNELNERFLLD